MQQLQDKLLEVVSELQTVSRTHCVLIRGKQEQSQAIASPSQVQENGCSGMTSVGRWGGVQAWAALCSGDRVVR